ncbi:hypothetical protein [Prevotella jejuni]
MRNKKKIHKDDNTLTVKAGEFHVMFKIGMFWIIPFCVAVIYSSMMGKYRYHAILAIAGTVWGLMIEHLSWKRIEITFHEKFLLINGSGVLTESIMNYYTCLPLQKFFMLRLRMKDGTRKIYYLPIKYRDEIERYMSKRSFLLKEKADGFLQYAHLLFVLIAMCFGSLCFLLMSK